jgi:hypothetical protein
MRLFYAITNRMYCDYYKLFKIIIEYVNCYVPDKKLSELIKVNDHFPVYKDLEPFKQYDFHHIQSLHEVIIVILTYLNTFIINKEHDLKVYQTKNKIGLNIDSFVNTFNFNNTVMKEKTTLFITYIEFFHKLHTKYMKRFTMKLQLMMSQINNDIKLDNPNETKTTKKDILNDFKENNIDKTILRELKLSVSDENSITSSDKSKTPEPRESSNSNASEESYEESIQMNVPTNTPESSSIVEIYEHNNCEQVSELSDDNKCENNIIVRYKLDNTIIEGQKEAQSEEREEGEEGEPQEKGEPEEEEEEEGEGEGELDEKSNEINNILFQPINESDKKKKRKKKKKKNKNENETNISIENIRI